MTDHNREEREALIEAAAIAIAQEPDNADHE